MTSAYRAVRATASPEFIRAWDSWEALFLVAPRDDELGQPVSKTVHNNLRRDGMIGRKGCRYFIAKLLLDPAGTLKTFTNFQEAIKAFTEACYESQRLGTDATIPDGILWHVMTESDLKDSIAIYRPDVSDPTLDAWDRFQRACNDGDTAQVDEYVRGGFLLNPRGYQVFSTIADNSGPEGGDPDSWNASDACDALGLSTKRTGYRPGTPLWMIKYRTNALNSRPKVPTFADAGYNSIFLPSLRRRNVPYGRTRPLRRFKPQRGMPEVVHACAALAFDPASASGYIITATLDGAPRPLGVIT